MTSLEILTDRPAVGLDIAHLKKANRTAIALLIMRLSVFLVMLIWTMYRFVRLEHATSLSEYFYSYTGATAGLAYMLAIAEFVLLTAFMLGMAPRITYGIVFLIQAISTFSFHAQYPRLCEPANIQFFAAWPMLAACFALYYLRDLDTLRYSVD